MTLQEHLMIRAMEECDETSQRLSKALIFGLAQKQSGQDMTNAERVMQEFTDLLAVMAMAGFRYTHIDPSAIDAKREKVERYLVRSAALGTLECSPSDGISPSPSQPASEDQ